MCFFFILYYLITFYKQLRLSTLFCCSNPEFQKSMKEFGEKLGVVKEDLKVRYKLAEVSHFFHFESSTYSG